MKLHNSMSAIVSAASKTGAAALATAHYFLFELSHRRAGKLYKTAHCAENTAFKRAQNSKDFREN